MKRKLLSFQMACVLLSLNLSPVLGFADELSSTESTTPSEEETTGTDQGTGESTPIETPPADSSTTESETGTTESSVTPEKPAPQKPTTPQQPNTPVQETPAVGEIQPVINNSLVEEFTTDQEISVVKNEPTDMFIRRIGERARAVGQKNDLYASVMIAQAILETGAGSSQLSQEPHYNLFGIKGEFEGQSVVFSTQEDDGTGKLYQIDAAFKKYPSFKESFEDYAKLMKEGTTSNPEIYAGTWKANAVTYQEATKSLTGVYATDTNYDKKLNAFIEEYNLTEYDKAEPSKDASGLIIADSHPDSDFPDYSGETYSGSEAYAAGNCTQYVYNRIMQIGGYVETNMGNGMDWSATGKAFGYEVSQTPKAGTAVSFQPGVAGADSTYGHVAFVEHVYEDGSILISEMNAAGLGVVSFRVIDENTANTLAYVTPK